MGDGYRGQNPRLLDAIKAAFGIPTNFDLTTVVGDRVLPVVSFQPDTAPIVQYQGQSYATSAAGGAGFRSEHALTNNGDPGSIVVAYATVINCDGTNGYRAVLGVTPVGFTAVNNPYADIRLTGSTGNMSGTVILSRKNSAAATSTGVTVGDALIPVAGTNLRLGPFWIPRGTSVLVRSTTDNLVLQSLWDWAYMPANK